MTETDVRPSADPNTGLGLIQFLDAAIDKGWFNISSAKALKTATQKVFELEAGWENLDLRSLDVDGLLDRFQNLRRNDYSDDSMRIYRTRFKQALAMHLARIDNDPNWKSHGPAARGTSTKSSTAPNGKKKTAKAVEQPNAETEQPEVPGHLPLATPQQRATLMEFPYPLRENLDVHLRLPRDLTKAEADRLGRFITSLARDERLAITTGNPQ